MITSVVIAVTTCASALGSHWARNLDRGTGDLMFLRRNVIVWCKECSRPMEYSITGAFRYPYYHSARDHPTCGACSTARYLTHVRS